MLQLDQAPYYGDDAASLSLSELIQYSSANNHTHDLADYRLLELSQRFNLSLSPMLLRAAGHGIDILVRSKVAAYLSFGMLEGIALVSGKIGGSTAVRVPASKADVFNHPTLSLIEKRRLTKLLLFAAGDEILETSPLLSGGLLILYKS